jgi:hypothetical protein
MHKKLLVLILFGIIVFISACSPKATFQSGWQTTPVTVDGNPSEWRIPLRFYDSDTKLNYTLSNDDEKIYLCVRIVDELSQAKVVRNGINIWFDTLAKKNKKVGILFPVPDRTADEDQADASRSSGSHHGGGKKPGSDLDAIKKKFLQQANQMQLTGFKSGIPDFLAASQNDYGINVSINWDVNNIMIYEAVIPFKTFYKPALVAKDSLRNFDFSMTIHGFPAPEKKDDGSSSGGGGGGMGGGGMGGSGGGMGGAGGGMGGAGGGRGGGGMGGGGGGRGGGMRGGNMAEANPMYETNSFWVKIRLAAK